MAATPTLTIDGESLAGPEAAEVVNPATGLSFALAPVCSDAQLNAAVEAAARAFTAWRATPVEARRVALRALADVLSGAVDELAPLLTREQGKPLVEARIELQAAAIWLQAAAGLELPQRVNEDSERRLNRTDYVPLGVVAVITPWNLPILLAAFKLGPALLAGNTVVWKPSPFTPLTTLRLGELLRDVLPPGVLNVISGQEDLGARLAAHPLVRKISFTGSTATGRRVMSGAAEELKRLTLELGGNDAAIVLDDVDADDAAKSLFWAAFRNSGQLCIAAKRAYIPRGRMGELCDALDAYAQSVRLGDGLEEGVRLGPLQNARQFDRVLGLIDDARATGGRLIRPLAPEPADGFFIPPTFVVGLSDTARLVAEEQFGPVLPLLSYDTVEEAVSRANASPYGLGATVWARDLDRAEAVATQLEAGTIWINEAHHISPFAALAGHKQSGMGAENGIDGLMAYLQPRTIVTRRSEDPYIPLP